MKMTSNEAYTTSLNYFIKEYLYITKTNVSLSTTEKLMSYDQVIGFRHCNRSSGYAGKHWAV